MRKEFSNCGIGAVHDWLRALAAEVGETLAALASIARAQKDDALAAQYSAELTALIAAGKRSEL